MSMTQKFAFFAPIWRVMRDEKMTVEEVQAQIEHVSLAVKVGSEISDMRHHAFRGKVRGDVLYFRAEQRGACTYVNDDRSDGNPYPHGDCWAEICHSLEVVDVPGDHFSILRQPDDQMQVMVKKLQQRLGEHGWVQMQELATEEGQEDPALAYLEQMGVPLEARLRLGAQRHNADSSLLEEDERLDIKALVTALNRAAEYAEERCTRAARKAKARKGKQKNVPQMEEDEWPSPIFVIEDSGSGATDVIALLSDQGDSFDNRPIFTVHLPSQSHLKDLDIYSLAALLAISISNQMSKLFCVENANDGSPQVCSIIAVGWSASLAHEVTVKLMSYKAPLNKREARRQGLCECSVESICFIEDSRCRRAKDAVRSPTFLCSDMVAANRPDLDLTLYSQVAYELRLSSSERDKHSLCLEYLLTLRPSSMDQGEWARKVNNKSKPAACTRLELATWSALFSFIIAEASGATLGYDSFLLSMHRLRDSGEAQLDWISSLCPDHDSSSGRLAWEARINEVIFTTHFLVEGTEKYKPSDVFAGERVLFVSGGPKSTALSCSVFSSGPLEHIAHHILPIGVVPWSPDESERKDQLLRSISSAEQRSSQVNVARSAPSHITPMNQICCAAKAPHPNLLGRPTLSRFFLDSVISAARQWGLPMFISGTGSGGGAESESSPHFSQSLPPLVTSQPLFICHLETKLQAAELSLLTAHLHLPAYVIAFNSNHMDDYKQEVESLACSILSIQPTGPWGIMGVGIHGGLVASSIARMIESKQPHSSCCLLLLDGSPHIPSGSAKSLVFDIEPRLLFQASHSLIAKEQAASFECGAEPLPTSYFFFLTRYRQHLLSIGVHSAPSTVDFMNRYCPPSISVGSWEMAVGEAISASTQTIKLMMALSKMSPLVKMRGACGVMLSDHFNTWMSPSAASQSAMSDQGSDQSSTLLIPPVEISHNQVQHVVSIATVEEALRSTIAGPSTILTLDDVGLSSPSGRTEVSSMIATVFRDLLSLL